MYPNLFECADNTLLPDYYVCDGRNDCPSGGDEVNCSDICSYQQDIQQECFTTCLRPNCECFDLYHQCESGGCIPSTKICDCYADCTDASDEAEHLCTVALCNVLEINMRKTINRNLVNPIKARNDVFDLCIKDTYRDPYHVIPHSAPARNWDAAAHFFDPLFFNEVCNESNICSEWKNVIELVSRCLFSIPPKPTECPRVHHAYRSFFDSLFYDELCDGKQDCVYGIDEWFTNCTSVMYFAGIRCP